MSKTSEEVADATVRKHGTNYSAAGWSCDCGHHYRHGVASHQVEDHRMAAAVEADRAQRPGGRVLTVPSAGWRVAVDSPQETYEILADLLTDYTWDEIEWEAN